MHKSRGLSCLLLVALLITILGGLLTPAAEAAAYSDISKHWAKADIEFVSGQGIIAGYSDNTFRPDRNVTRAEYIAMINRTFRLTASLPNTFSDVKSSDWFAADIGKARAAGYISGYSDGTIRPQKSITRQEAAFMIAKVLGLSGVSLDSVSKYKDKKSIGSWSLNAVAAVVNRGYMGGYPDSTFRPTSFIKRAEAAVVMRAVYGSSPGTPTPSIPSIPISQGDTSYDQAGTYGPSQGQQSIQGDVNITATGVTLRNTSISGDLLIARSVGSGSVTLSNVVVQGTLKVEGGGPHSVVLDNSTIPDIIVSKAGVRVVAQGSTDVNRVVLTTGAALEESGLSGSGFEKVSISSTGGIGVDLTGSFDSVTVSASADIALSSGSRISTLTLNSSATITGKGAITNAYVNASGVYIAQTPSNTVVASNISASVGGETISGNNGSSAPVFKSGYPKASNIKDTYFDLLVKTDESGYVYYVVLGNGDKAPSSKQVKSGQNGSGSSVSSSRYGSRSLSANSEGSIRISNLTEGTAYDIYVVAENNDGNLQSSPSRVDMTASENNSSAPDFYSGYPKKYEVTSTTLEFLTKIDEDGKVYYVVLPSYSSTPTPAQVKAGTNASGSTVSSNLRGTIYLNKDTQDSEVVSSLTANTSYTLYVVAEDDYYNLQTTVKSLDFTTLSSNSCILAFSSYTASVAENASTVTITVNRTGTSSGTARVYYSTYNGTAVAGSDYYSTTGYLDWASGVTTAKSFTVPIINDTLVEGSETFTVALDTPSGASLGNPSTITVTITDDDVAGAGTIAFSASSASINENAGSVPLTVTRTGGSVGAASVQYYTTEGSAKAGYDYTSPPASSYLTWTNGDSSNKTIYIPIINDTDVESAEVFTVTLSNVTGAALGTPNVLTITINSDDVQPLAISTTNPTSATQGTAYTSFIFTASGGTNPYIFQITSGSIPGMTLSSSGVLTGTPTTAGNIGFTVTVSDSASIPLTASHNYTITVNPAPSPLTIGTGSLLDAIQGTAYSTTFSASGGTTPYKYSYTGILPVGLSLGETTGVLDGTPVSNGPFSFTVRVTDNAGAISEHLFSLKVNPPLAIDTIHLPPDGVKGNGYSYNFSATGGSGVYSSYQLTSGALPSGLDLAADGTLAGTLTVSNTFKFIVTVTDSVGGTSSHEYSIVITDA